MTPFSTASEGLVGVKVNRGFFMPELNLQELADNTEALAARLAVERGDFAWEAALARKPEELARLLRTHYEATAQVILASGSFAADAVTH